MTVPRSKLIFVHPSDELYGADRMLLEMLDALRQVPLEVWLPNDLPHSESPLCVTLASRGVAVRHMQLPIMRRSYANPRGMARLAQRMIRLGLELRRAKPETVYCTTSAAMVGAPVARLAGVSTVIGHVQEIWSRTDRRTLAPATAACHRLLAISGPVAESLGPCLAARARIVPNGSPDPGRIDLPSRHGPLTYVVASRWNAWKGHQTLLAAWDRLEMPGRLVILGSEPPVGTGVDVRAIVSRLRRPETVTITGQVTEVAPYLAAADVAIVPSDEPEPFGLVAIESFAHGRPVIGSSAGGLVDIINPGRDGWLFPPKDVDALSSILGRLTREEVSEAGLQARRTYEQRFTASAYADRWLEAAGLG